MAERYADTVPRLADYLWWLLPGFFKRKPRSESWTYRLLDAFGAALEELRDQVRLLERQFTAETAEGSQLDQIGRSRGTFRLPGEDDDSFRVRVRDAYVEKQKAGTTAGMVDGLGTLGFGVEVMELYPTDRSRWSEFVVRVLTWDGTTPQEVFYDDVNRLKPAHTRMIADPQVQLDVFDDGGSFDDGGRFDTWRLP